MSVAMRINGHGSRVPRHHGYESSSMISSDLESTSFFDSDDDASSRITATTTGMGILGSQLHLSWRNVLLKLINVVLTFLNFLMPILLLYFILIFLFEI